MKLLKPHWVHHDDKPIFSVDVHQECLKFATGGQGNDSGRVVIWNLLPVLSEKAELDDSVPKILCQMDNHLACVNCVRWSQNGEMLSSGSDDKLVMIWIKSKGSSGVFGTGGIKKNPESWKCIATLRGHSGDVLDLAWSPHDRWLASCSVDNSIIVWDCQAWPAMVAMLKGHTGLVKGVAWDPVGKFLASQSDDRSVKIWKTCDWTCNSTITEPFEECGGTTHILRLSWSPDGQYLVSAHAMNGGGPTAQIIEREGWKCDKDFVGHRKAVTCVRFHNSILKRQAPKTNKPQQYCCLAVGSRDRSLSVWMTALQRPLVVIHDLFQDSILDLSWGPEKYLLLACSGDGTVACLQFSENELGTPLSEDDKNSIYQRIYGKSAILDTGSSGRDMLIENAELLNSSQEKLKPPTLPSLEASNLNNNYAHSLQIQPPNGCPTIMSSGIFDSCSSGSTLVKAINKQTETRTADGKRRITPVFIPVNQDVGDCTPQLNSSSRPINNVASSVLDVSKTNTFAVPSEVTSVIKPVITEAEQTRLDNRLTKISSTSTIQPSQANANGVKTFPTISIKTSASVPDSRQISGPPRLNITQSTKCDLQKSTHDFRIIVQNGNVQTTLGPLCKVTCWAISTCEKLWEIFLGSAVVNFSFCFKYLILCSLDGTLRILNIRTAKPMLPIISLPTNAIQCTFCPFGKLVGVITECGLLRIWDVEKEEITVATGCSEIFGKNGQVIQYCITEHGMPFVLFSNGNSYTYSPGMKCWMVLNSKDPILRHGLQTTAPKDFQKNFRMYPLATVQCATNNFSSIAIDMNSNDWQSAAKLIFIENQIKLCESIQSSHELKHWYSMLAYHLATNGTEKRIRLLLDELLQPEDSFSVSSRKKQKINPIPKHTLLEAVLNVIKLHSKWQRLYMEYCELVSISCSSHSNSIGHNINKNGKFLLHDRHN